MQLTDDITHWLSDIDPENRALYQRNRTSIIHEIEQLKVNMTELMKPISDLSYLVFHDAFQYFEREYQLNPLTSITRSPTNAPGIKQVVRLKSLLNEQDVVCVFKEPQFESKIIPTIVEDTNTRVSELDPIGAEITPGPKMWFQLMQAIGTNLKNCLSPG